MAIKYLDLENGNDANSGNDFANAWKTFSQTNGLSLGDEVRIAKSAAPVSIGNATYSNGSRSITLASAKTKTIDRCESGWGGTFFVNHHTNRKEGSFSARASVSDTDPAPAKLMFKTLASAENFSAYQKVTFWIKLTGSFPSFVDANTFRIALCSDTNGDTIVNDLPIPHKIGNGYWIPIELDNGAALGSSIQSVAIYWDSNAVTSGSGTIQLDNIEAANELTLRTLIGKNDPEGFFPIESIVGTSVIIGAYSRDGLDSTLGNYWGVSETVTSYALRPIDFWPESSGLLDEINSLAVYRGGFDTTSNIQDGETHVLGDGTTGYLQVTTPGPDGSVVEIQRLGRHGFDIGFEMNYPSGGTIKLVDCAAWSCGTRTGGAGANCAGAGGDTSFADFTNFKTNFSDTGIYQDGVPGWDVDGWRATNHNIALNGGTNAGWQSKMNIKNFRFSGCYSPITLDGMTHQHYNFSDGVIEYLQGGMCIQFMNFAGSFSTFKNVEIKDGTQGGFLADPFCVGVRFLDCLFDNNNNFDIDTGVNIGGKNFVEIFLANCVLNTGIGGSFYSYQTDAKSKIHSQMDAESPTIHKVYYRSGHTGSNTTDFRTVSPCVEMQKEATSVDSSPEELEVSFKAPMNNGQGRTLSIWAKRETDFAGKFKLGVKINGVLVIPMTEETLTTSYQKFSRVVSQALANHNGVVELVATIDGPSAGDVKVFLDDFEFV